MSYDKVKQANSCRVGLKQTLKSIEQKEVDEVIVAQDAEQAIIQKILLVCQKNDIPVSYVDSMRKLGKTCGIDVGAAVVSIKR